MTFYTYSQIIEWASNGGIDPYDESLVNPASIDLRWSGRYRKAIMTQDRWSGVREANALTMHRDEFYLLDTLEFITMPDDTLGFLMLKSSSGRNGLEHLHAGLFDPGFSGTATLETENRHPYPLTITKGQPIIQLCLFRGDVTALSYRETGRYNGQVSPTGARVAK